MRSSLHFESIVLLIVYFLLSAAASLHLVESSVLSVQLRKPMLIRISSRISFEQKLFAIEISI